MFGFRSKASRKLERENNKIDKMYSRIADSKEEKEFERELELEEQKNKRLKDLWQEKYNLVASNDGLKPYIEQIKDKLPAEAVNENWIDSIEYAPTLIGGYYEELKNAGASDKLMLAAYGQYLWETYIIKVLKIRIYQWQHLDTLKLLEDAKNDKNISQNMKSFLEKSAKNPVFFKYLAELSTEGYVSFISGNARDYNGNHLMDDLAINPDNQHNFTPADAFKAYWEYAGGSAFMTKFLDFNENYLFENDKSNTVVPTDDEILRFTYSGKDMFEKYDEYGNVNVTARKIKENNLDIYTDAIEFLNFVYTKWADDISIVNFSAPNRPELMKKRMEELKAYTQKLDDKTLEDRADYLQFGAIWRMFDIYEFFGYSYDNMPAGWDQLDETKRNDIDKFVKSVGTTRDYNRFPEGCAAKFLP